MNKNIFFLLFLLSIAACVTVISCNSKTTNITTEKTDECTLKEEICDEALDFQKEYEKLPKEEKKDMATVLETYIKHCEEATNNCEKSKK